MQTWPARALRGLIGCSRRIAASKWETPSLFFVSAAETTVVPVPIELLLVPHMAANRDRALGLATVTLAGCLFGASLGYVVGLLLFESLGIWLIDIFGWQKGFTEFRGFFDAYGFWAIVALGIVPIPFQTAMLLAGLAQYPFWLFLLAAVISRGARYYGLAALVIAIGQGAEAAWRRHSGAVGIGLTLLIIVAVGVFVVASLLQGMISPHA